MANEFLSLPTGLTEADYPVADNLLDYTPPNVRWQAPLASTGENVFANYVKAYPDILRDYNRRLARPMGTAGALPMMEGGYPQSMASYGLSDWNTLGQAAGRTLNEPVGLWGDPGRNPYIAYGGRGPLGQAVGSEYGVEPNGDTTTEQQYTTQTIQVPTTTSWTNPNTGEVITYPGEPTWQTIQVPVTGTTDTTSPPISATTPPSVTPEGTTTTGVETVVETEVEEEVPVVEEEVVEEEVPVVEEEESELSWMDPKYHFGHYWTLSMTNPSYVWDWASQAWTYNGSPLY